MRSRPIPSRPQIGGHSWTPGAADQVAGDPQPPQEDEDGPQDDARRRGDRRCDPGQSRLVHRSEAPAGRLERLIRSQETHSRRKKTKTVLKMMLDAAVIDDAIPANPVSSTDRRPQRDAWSG